MLVWLYTILHLDLSVHTKELTAVFEKIFTPIKIRDLVLDSRVVMTARAPDLPIIILSTASTLLTM